jgi:hypothetical protein
MFYFLWGENNFTRCKNGKIKNKKWGGGGGEDFLITKI